MRFYLVLCVFLSLSGTAMAASFECDKAVRPREKTICADPDLSSLDERLAEAYRNVRKRLSANGKVRMAENQRRWLRALGEDFPTTEEITVLRRLYRDRSDLLMRISQTGTPVYLVGWSRTDLPSKGWIHAEWPEFDGDAPWIAEANDAIAQLLEAWIPDDTVHSLRTEFSIGTSTSNLISLSMEFLGYPTEYSIGASYNRAFLNFDPSNGREVILADFFRRDVAWHDLFVAACGEVVDGTDLPVAIGGFLVASDGIEVECAEKQRSNDLPPMAVVPWDRLRPFLSAGVPMQKKR